MIDSVDRDYDNYHIGAIPREHRSFGMDDCPEYIRITKLNILDLDIELNETAFEINDLAVTKRGLSRWGQLIGHKYRRIMREARKGITHAEKFAEKYGGHAEVGVGTNFGPNNTTPPPPHPSDIKNVPLNRSLPPPPPPIPEISPLTRTPIQELVNHPSPLTPTPTYQPHHYQLPDSKPIHFDTLATNPIVHYPSPQITPPSKEVTRTETESPPPETKQKEVSSEPTALQETAHPIRRTEETERIGSIAIASMKTSCQATSKPPTLMERVSSGLREAGSALTHLSWRGVSAVVVQIHSLGELFNPTPSTKIHLQASKEGREPKTFQEEWYNDISPKVHQKIDDFFSTNNKEEFDFRNLPPEKQFLETFFASTTALPANVGKIGTVARGEAIGQEAMVVTGATGRVAVIEEAAIAHRQAGTEKIASLEARLGNTAQKPIIKNELLAQSASEIALTEETANSTAYNRATFEQYKTVLRVEMEKPHVVDNGLKIIVDDIFRPNAKIGSGSTAAAIRHEKMTGEMVSDKMHSQKGRESIKRLELWLKQNPTASLGDRAAAENIILDLKNALGIGQ